MKTQLTVVGLGGSLAAHSNSLAALRIALEGAAEAGAKTELLDIRELSLPISLQNLPVVPLHGDAAHTCKPHYSTPDMRHHQRR